MADTLNPARSSPIQRIEALIETLRGENGCPWDRKQTPRTMTRYLLEEVYELADAIIAGDAQAVCEESGDVLFQLMFLIHLFAESGAFCLDDVVDKNVAKMVRRHPHVFGDATAETPEQVRENWDKIKSREKGRGGGRSVLASIPKGLPALLRAAMVSERAAKTGFDWDGIAGVMAQTMEEWEEFSTEIQRADRTAGDEKAATEFGDVLFTMVNVARFAGIHPEVALIRSIQKFERRFAYLEKQAVKEGKAVDRLSFQEMQTLWDEAKSAVG